MTLPDEKEMNFYGTPWPVGKHGKPLKSLSSFTFDYLGNFKLAAPGEELHVYGEASPDYLVSFRQVSCCRCLLDFFFFGTLCFSSLLYS
jgi:hypothetical protein